MVCKCSCMTFRYGVMNDEERKKTKLIFMRSDFLTQTKVSGTFRVVLHLDSKVLLVYKLFALLLTRLGSRAPIPYVQDAILNLHHPYCTYVHVHVRTCSSCDNFAVVWGGNGIVVLVCLCMSSFFFFLSFSCALWCSIYSCR